ncbi:RNA-directed DNA polymerase, eukaryota, reverse transcriptase zinc-binding domain protein [Tanacetum coccineum]
MDQEDDINKVSPEIAVSSDLSRPSGFEHMKRTSSKYSTSFTRYRKKDIKGVSLIEEFLRYGEERHYSQFDIVADDVYTILLLNQSMTKVFNVQVEDVVKPGVQDVPKTDVEVVVKLNVQDVAPTPVVEADQDVLECPEKDDQYEVAATDIIHHETATNIIHAFFDESDTTSSSSFEKLLSDKCGSKEDERDYGDDDEKYEEEDERDDKEDELWTPKNKGTTTKCLPTQKSKGTSKFEFRRRSSMARGRSGGLISTWDPNSYIRDDIWCDDAFIIVKGHSRNTDANNFNSFIDNSGLIDLPLGGRLFTWIHKARTKLSKLDRFLISEEVGKALPDVRVTSIHCLWLDHNLILLHVSKSDFGPIPFKLFYSWLLRDSFDKVIKTKLPKWEEHNFGRKLLSDEKFHLLKARIKQWHYETKTSDHVTKHDNLKFIKSIKEKIEVGSTNDDERDSRIKLLQEVDRLDTFESFDLFQKARVKWEIAGDENSNFFHGLIKPKRELK